MSNRQIIRFSGFFIPAAVFSALIVVSGIAGYIYHAAVEKDGGFNLGVDFKAGLMQEVQLAPSAFSVSYEGSANAVLNYKSSGINIVITGSKGENTAYPFLYSAYPDLNSLGEAMKEAVPGISVTLNAPGETKSAWLLESAQGNPQLGSKPFNLHYLEPAAKPVKIDEVRAALEALGTPSVQELGVPEERRFMIRMEDENITQDKIVNTLEEMFGTGNVAVTRAEYVGSRFSRQLQTQAFTLMALTLLVIFIYAAIRFRPQFAFGAVIATAHDALIMIAFIVWSRMEFNTTTIAALLTILGYSINDTIVIFDRIRETRALYPDDDYEMVLNRAVTETLSRTIITTVTTMLAVLSLFIFTTGTMKDFALLLLIGMAFGVYSTIYIASGFTLFWERRIKPLKRRKAERAQAVRNAVSG